MVGQTKENGVILRQCFNNLPKKVLVTQSKNSLLLTNSSVHLPVFSRTRIIEMQG